MNFQECLEKGLIAKARPDKAKALASLKMSERKIGIAEQELAAKIFETALTNAYASMFHSARALLFNDGFKERSHFALFVFLSENYSSKLEKRFVSEFDYLRTRRHDLLYGLEIEESKKPEAEHSIKTAKEFLQAVKKIIK